MNTKDVLETERRFRTTHNTAIRASTNAIVDASNGNFPQARKNLILGYTIARNFLHSIHYSIRYEEEVLTLLETIDGAQSKINDLARRAFE